MVQLSGTIHCVKYFAIGRNDTVKTVVWYDTKSKVRYHIIP